MTFGHPVQPRGGHGPQCEDGCRIKANRVCFHGWHRCRFCWGGEGYAPRAPRRTIHCPACHRARLPRRGICGPCRERGVTAAPRLPFGRAA